MSLITGYLKQISAQPADSQVTVRAVAFGVVTLSGALVVPDQITVKASATTGFWSVTLTKGSYELSVRANNGQTAKCTITIPDEDTETYPFEELIVSALPAPEDPVGGARPTASPTVQGLVKIDEIVANPIVPTGWFFKTTQALLKAVPNLPNNKVGVVFGTTEMWGWSETSLAAASASVLLPDDTDPGDPGRWILMEFAGGGGGGGAGGFEIVADKAALKALASNAATKAVLVIAPEAGMTRFYEARFGDATAADDFEIIEPTDGGARYFTLA